MNKTRFQRKIFRMKVQNSTLLHSDGDNLCWDVAFDENRIHVTMDEIAAQKPGDFNLQSKQDLTIISNTICNLQNDCRLLKQNLFYSAL